MTPTFRWTCSYRGSVWYEVRDATGVYEAELRRTLSDDDLAEANGDDVRSEMRTALGILRRSHSIPVQGAERTYEMPAATVTAFNAWRAAEHARLLADMRAQPHRYGQIADDDPLAKAPEPVARGRYVLGENRWERL